jgi:hypothetical protein
MTGKLGFISALANRLAARSDDSAPPPAVDPVASDEAATPPPPALTPAVEAVLAAIDRLRWILDEETALLETSQSDEALFDLVSRKADAEAKYRGAIAALQCEPGGVGALPADVRALLTAAAQALSDAAAANIAAVTAARDAQTRLVELIVDSLRKERRSEVGYGWIARTAASPYVRPAPPAPAALSRVL